MPGRDGSAPRRGCCDPGAEPIRGEAGLGRGGAAAALRGAGRASPARGGEPGAAAGLRQEPLGAAAAAAASPGCGVGAGLLPLRGRCVPAGKRRSGRGKQPQEARGVRGEGKGGRGVFTGIAKWR